MSPAVCEAARSCGVDPDVGAKHGTTAQTRDRHDARACTIVLSFDVIGAPGAQVRRTDPARVTMQGRIVERIDCVHASGSDEARARGDDGVLRCTALCGRLSVASTQANLRVTLLSASRQAISSPHIIPFLLLLSSSGSTGAGTAVGSDRYSISVLPMRLLHGTCERACVARGTIHGSCFMSHGCAQACAQGCAQVCE